MSRQDLIEMIEQSKMNPMSVQRSAIEYLERVTGGEVQIVDSSNAFVYLMEFASTLYANLQRKDVLLNMRQYPEMSQTREELYHHMSDVDYINVFGAPSTADLMLIYNLDEVIEKAVPVGTSGMKKLVIPRHTEIQAGDIPFTLQYPVEIRVLPHGGIQTVFDNRLPSPTMPLESNYVQHWITNYNATRTSYLQIEVPCQQVQISHYTTPLTASKIFNKTYNYKDQFYYCRVYISTGPKTWREIKTTHSDLVFDPSVVTAQLKVLDGNQLNVSIPQIYYSSGLATGNVRVDIYTTRGALEVEIKGYPSELFTTVYNDYDHDDNGLYTAPVYKLTASQFVATSSVTGGANALPFDKLKQRVIHNALGPIDLPITNVQIQSQLDRLTDAGFSCVTDIDNVTNRLYAASRMLPKPEVEAVSTGVGASLLTLSQTVDQIVTSADVMDNGERITILPSTLYRDMGGYLSIVGAQERDSLLNERPERIAELVNQGKFLYSPFHCVLDFTDGVFSVRPYYFGEPEILRKFFVEDNGTYGAGIRINSHVMERTQNGWVLTVMTNGSDEFKELDSDSLAAQLAFVPVGEISRVYLNGEMIARVPETGEWVFQFEFNSTWDVDGNDSVYLSGFERQGVSPHAYACALTQRFDIFYMVDRQVFGSGATSAIDDNMGSFMFSTPVGGIYHEQLDITLGHELSGLWARARTTVGEEQYLRYTEDVPRLHTSNVPAKTETGAVQIEYDNDGKPQVVYAHRAGDPVMEDGNVVLLHRRGDPVLENGSPVLMNPRSVLRQIDFVLFEGSYYFVTSPTDLAYRDEAPLTIVRWVNETLKPIRDRLLENTKLWFHPKTTVGRIDAIADGGLKVNLDADQHILVEYYLDSKVYRDEELKEEIRKTTRATVSELFNDMQVTRDGIATALRDATLGNVLSVKVSRLGGEKNYSVITMTSESSRLCIGKRLVALPNTTLGVEDSIDIVFNKHSD